MDLSDSEEQLTLRKHLATFFGRESSPVRVRASEPLGFDRLLWAEIFAMGLPSMAVPETLGGGGASTQDLALAAEEFGRRIAPAPLIETCVANNLLAHLAQSDPAGPAGDRSPCRRAGDRSPSWRGVTARECGRPWTWLPSAQSERRVEGADGPVPSVCGTYADHFVKLTQGWRFQRREIPKRPEGQAISGAGR